MKKSGLIDAARTKNTVTYNGALTHETSLSNCVDMFFLAGASRTMSESDIITVWEKAKAENLDYALKILFWARDVRGGAGERRFFRIIWDHIWETDRERLWHGLYHDVPEYGRWDDIFYKDKFIPDVVELIRAGLEGEDGLLAKWLPRKGVTAAKIRQALEWSPKRYRKTLVTLSNTVEQKMSDNEWSEIKYSHVPSVALHKYRSAFLRNDEARFREYLGNVESGDEKINADVLFPHMLYKAFRENKDPQAIRAQWNSLPNFMEGSDTQRILPICDVSGSMTTNKSLPMDVSVSLGCYISERNEGIFKDAFITFSQRPEMQYLKGDIISRFRQLRNAQWDMNTDLQAVFNLILTRAKRERLPASEMPDKLLIISDMEFDQATRNYGHQTETNLELINRKYEQSGYERPDIVFWNVNGRIGNSPATFREGGIGLVSGFSPSILKGILSGKILSPEHLMKDVILSERYNPIHAPSA